MRSTSSKRPGGRGLALVGALTATVGIAAEGTGAPPGARAKEDTARLWTPVSLAQQPRVAPPPAAPSKRLSPAEGSDDPRAARGWERYRRGDVEGARSDLAAAAADSAAPPWVPYALGLVEFALGQATDAAAAFEHVRAAEAAFQPVYFDLVDAYLRLDRLDRAAAVLDEARARWPRNAEVWNALGVIETRRDAFDRAIRAFETAAEVNPGDPLAYFNLGKAYELRSQQPAKWDSMGRRRQHAERDRRLAREHYARYLAAGGPYAQEARAALARLDWVR